MSHSRFQKSALAAAVLSLGFSMGALAQGSAGSSDSTLSNRSDSMTSQAATSASNGKAASSDKMAKSDRRFLEEAYIGSMAEVRLGKLAQDKASRPEVKEFAQRMIDDHGKETEKLSKIASEDGVTLPSQLDSKHQKTYDRLAKLSGAEFDRAYMKEMSSDHKKDVSEYEHAAKSAKDDQVKQHASQELSTLREHEKLAKSTMDDVKKGSTVSMGQSSRSSMPSRSQSEMPPRSPSPSQPSNR